MLTCALKAQVMEFKSEIKNKFYIESITFGTYVECTNYKNKPSTFVFLT